VRLGVKFWIHPLAMDDVMHAAQEGMTKIDRYRHQYFVSLEVYALNSGLSQEADDLVEQRVDERIGRSTMFLIATGNPPTRSKRSSSRDWLISIMDTEHSSRADPLNRFPTDPMAAGKILDMVRDDLQRRGRLREYQADFLLYAIIDRAASEMTAIYNAYGRRLRWLQDCLDSKKSVPTNCVEEVSRARLELQELRQWVGQLKGIMRHLEEDCKDDASTDAHLGVPWNFGAHARGKGRSMLLFIRHTQDYLEQAGDRLTVLDDFARNFIEEFNKHQSAVMNNMIFVLTAATAVFLPAQFFAGVYGMNFVDEDGQPSIPELRWRYGYYIFWAVTGCMILSLVVIIAMKVMRKQTAVSKARCSCCCRPFGGLRALRRQKPLALQGEPRRLGWGDSGSVAPEPQAAAGPGAGAVKA